MAVAVVIIGSIANYFIARGGWKRQSDQLTAQAKMQEAAAAAAWKRDRRFEVYSDALKLMGAPYVRIATSLKVASEGRTVPPSVVASLEEYRVEAVSAMVAAYALGDDDVGESLQAWVVLITTAVNAHLGATTSDYPDSVRADCLDGAKRVRLARRKTVGSVQASLSRVEDLPPTIDWNDVPLEDDDLLAEAPPSDSVAAPDAAAPPAEAVIEP